VRHGKIVAEAYYAPYAAGIRCAIYSVTKAVSSTLTAIAWKDGLLELPLEAKGKKLQMVYDLAAKTRGSLRFNELVNIGLRTSRIALESVQAAD
jgi:hypothetical protein